MPIPSCSAKSRSCTPRFPDWETIVVAPGCGTDVRSAAEEAVVGVADPHRVGAEDQDARLPRRPDQFLFLAPPLGARFGKTGGDQEHVPDPLFLELGDQLEDLGRRDGHHGQIHRARDLCHRLESRSSGDRAPFGVDQIDRPLEPARGHVAEEPVSPLAEGAGGPDEGDGTGVEELTDRESDPQAGSAAAVRAVRRG